MNARIPNCFGLDFLGYDTDALDVYFFRNEFDQVSTVNAEFIITAYDNKKFLQVLNNSICTVDGQIPLWIAKHKGQNSDVLRKVSGSSYSEYVLDLCIEKKLKVFFLGGKKSSIDKLLERYYLYNGFGGYSPIFEDYPFSEINQSKIQQELKDFSPDILFVGFGAVKQEFWIYDNKEFLVSLGVRTAIGVGGTFEFLSGSIPRAPRFIQKVGLESLYRLLQQPSVFRLRRILKSLKIFQYLISKKDLE